MSKPTIGIIGGGQLGSMLSTAAKNLNIKTVIISDDEHAPAKFFADEFIFCKYNDELKIEEFSNKIDFVTFEFENIPYETLCKIDNIKRVNPKPSINKIIQNRLSEKDFLNKNNIKFPLLGKPIRYLLTDNYNGPSIIDIFVILGKKDSLERLNRYKI